jgi:acetolactate decarboxylase
VAKKQSEFEFTNIKGVIVAFRYPQYLGGINLAGYHHFITADRQGVGHLRLPGGEDTLALHTIPNLDLRLPQT